MYTITWCLHFTLMPEYALQLNLTPEYELKQHCYISKLQCVYLKLYTGKSSGLLRSNVPFSFILYLRNSGICSQQLFIKYRPSLFHCRGATVFHGHDVQTLLRRFSCTLHSCVQKNVINLFQHAQEIGNYVNAFIAFVLSLKYKNDPDTPNYSLSEN